MSIIDSGGPLAFHHQHGANIDLLDGRRRAIRRISYEKSLCYSHRPLRINEPFIVTIQQVEGGWTGHLRIGLTRLNPSTLSPLSRLESLSSNDTWLVPISSWDIPAPKRLLPTEVGSRVGVYLESISSSTGRLHLILNDIDVIPSLPQISLDNPLYAFVDVYGSTKEVCITSATHSPDSLSSLCIRSVRSLLLSSSISHSLLPQSIQCLFDPQLPYTSSFHSYCR